MVIVPLRVCVETFLGIYVKKFVHKGLGVRGLLNIPELTARVCISTIFLYSYINYNTNVYNTCFQVYTPIYYTERHSIFSNRALKSSPTKTF